MKKLSFALAVLSIGNILAQENGRISNPYYSPSTERKEALKAMNVDVKNAFKFDPLHMVVGELNFAWEHRLDEHSSFEVELGPTISAIDDISVNHYMTESNSAYTTPQMGALVSVAYRFYPLDNFNAMNKFYVSPKFKYRRYNYMYNDGTASGLGDQNGYSNEATFFFNIGFQKWLSNHFALDFYTGIGLGSIQGKTWYQQYNYDYMTGLSSYQWIQNSFNNARIMGTIGMKVSFGN